MEKKRPFWLRMLIIMVLSLLAWVFVIVFVASIWTAGKSLFIDWPRRPILT